MNQSRLANAYALDALSFIFLDRDASKVIRSAYLFGSAVRDELDTESDIDIFLDCENKNEATVKSAARRGVANFMRSKDFDKWKLLKFTHEISIHAGPLEEWELRKSIAAEGITLFSRAFASPKMVRRVIFKIELPKSKPAYLKITRELFGRHEVGFASLGLVEKQGGEKVSSDVFIVPKSSQTMFARWLHENKVNYTMREILATEV